MRVIRRNVHQKLFELMAEKMKTGEFRQQQEQDRKTREIRHGLLERIT